MADPERTSASASSDSEPDVFEADSCHPSPSAPATSHYSRPASPQVFGDADAPFADEMEPVKAFEVFAGRTFPRATWLDFSGDVSRQLRGLNASAPKRGRADDARGALGRESRESRIERLRAEVLEIADEGEGGASEASELCFSELREVIGGLAAKEAAALSTSGGLETGGGVDSEDAHEPVAMPRAAVSIPGIHDMDRRVAALESCLGPGADAGPGGLWGLVEGARTELDALDAKRFEAARGKALDLATCFDDNAGVTEVVDLASLLARIAAIEPAVAAIPTLVARLRTVKFGLDDAGGVARALGELVERCEKVVSARSENVALVEVAKESMESNARTVGKNMEALEERLRAALAVESEREV